MKIIKNTRDHILKFKENHKIEKILLTLGIVFSSIFISGFTVVNAQVDLTDVNPLEQIPPSGDISKYDSYFCSIYECSKPRDTYSIEYTFFNSNEYDYSLSSSGSIKLSLKDGLDASSCGQRYQIDYYLPFESSYVSLNSQAEYYWANGGNKYVSVSSGLRYVYTNNETIYNLMQESGISGELLAPQLLDPVKSLPSQIVKDGSTVLPIGLAVLSAVLLIFLVRRSVRLAV
ncbi:MAG: hypothetical protein E7E43_15490 [Thomasclavelia ramosa]|nr:hypothetical protein [Thomasclavelia ramosa]